ncbi:BatD family protein [Paraglaciecola aestuariivivens]
MVKLSKTKSVWAVVCLLLSQLCLAQNIQVTASVDKNPVMVDESFILTVVANGDVDRDAFDASILMQDFVVGRTSVSSQTQMINFTTTKSTTWSTTLIPTKVGRFTIPAFNVAKAKTQPIEINVIPMTAQAAQKGRDLFVTTEVDVNQVYLQQQIRYTVKLYLGQDLQRGSLSSPTLENADIRQIGKDKEYSEIVDGRRYRIIERAFAIIPQESGQFTIAGPLFEGEIIDNSRQSFGFFNRSKAVNRVGPSQQIEVLPIPSNYQQHWLPSDFVQLHDEWQGDAKQYIAGEPITRTLTLTAVGVVEEQLPEIASQYPDSVKVYPDQAETSTVEKDNTLIAQRKESIAIIPSQAGELVIPEVRLPWFNSITKKTEYAVLPEKVLQIQPSPNQNQTAFTPPSSQTLAIEPPVVSATDLNGEPAVYAGTNPYWQWLSLGLALVWLLTLMAWKIHVSRIKSTVKATASTARTHESEQALWKKLDKALSKNDAAQSQHLLGLWLGQWLGDKHASLNQSLAKLQNAQLTQATQALLAARYSANKTPWQATELHKLVRQLRKQKTQSSKQQQKLTALYPTGG